MEVIKYYDMVAGARLKSIKFTILPIAAFFLITSIFPKYQILISIPFVLVVAALMLPYLKTLISIKCPSCGGKCIPKNRTGLVFLTCESCKSDYETDCIYDYAGSKPRRKDAWIEPTRQLIALTLPTYFGFEVICSFSMMNPERGQMAPVVENGVIAHGLTFWLLNYSKED